MTDHSAFFVVYGWGSAISPLDGVSSAAGKIMMHASIGLPFFAPSQAPAIVPAPSVFAVAPAFHRAVIL